MTWISNPLSPEVQQDVVLGATINLVSLLSVVLRLYARKITKSGWKWDDWLLVVSTVFANALFVLFGFLVAGGVGRHITEPYVRINMPMMLKLVLSFEIIFGICAVTTKMSILTYYLRLFPHESVKLATKITMALILSGWTWSLSQILLQCRPISANWDLDLLRTCPLWKTTYIATAFVNLVADLLVLVLPIPHLAKMNITRQKKVGVIGLFTLSWSVSVIAGLRIYEMLRIDYDGDVTGTSETALFYATFEPNFVVIASSWPLIAPLWMKRWEAKRNARIAAAAPPRPIIVISEEHREPDFE
ncbi:uncharacterized protein BCR38DRAFT_481059 [Pseudomassariella vexata]|uniref:Rhodopsin domain-containing protein n=1 Tax=Pseudomassariella vexata TaxID=1141098 RepID=A0A1Y2EEA7_9PEZI|nr:uncharacterized protein BCR38DRAFT_481059 [Pseudomassariella vexata]ORY69900.1 hypothetical protein BCR38DRAFT_481059 [Pseudomassariella vexata]